MKKKLVLSSLILFVLSMAVFAQPGFTPQDRLKMLKDRLSLNEEQSVAVEKILVKSDEKMKELRSSGNFDFSQFRKIMEESSQKILKLLDKKQKVEFNKMLEERRNRIQNNTN